MLEEQERGGGGTFHDLKFLIFLQMKLLLMENNYVNVFFFFLSGFPITITDKSQDKRGREETIFYSTQPLPPAHEHSDNYMQLYM